jgi:hypothetical protein
VRLVATLARLLDLHNSASGGSRSTNVAQQPQVGAAAGYCAYLLDDNDRIVRRYEFEAANDSAAIETARQERRASAPAFKARECPVYVHQ